MRKFQFRLQSLENIKGMELDILRQELATAQAELRRAEEELINAREALNATYNELAELRAHQTEPMILLSLESYAGAMRDQVKACAQRVVQQSDGLRELRDHLSEKHKEKKVLEKHRERQFTKYSQHIERELQKELDEAAKNANQNHND